jgi:AcrR family transcriptional regulator
MTKTEILEAAYRVWGREFYQNTSLSYVARELGVSKPALYRHFANKNALLEAMTRHFFDDFALFIRDDYEKALENVDANESARLLIRSVTEYFARNVNFFIFSMTNLHDSELDDFNMLEKLCVRGIDFDIFHRLIKKGYVVKPVVTRLIFASLVFSVANFHRKAKSLSAKPCEAEISAIIGVVGKIIENGLGYGADEVMMLDFGGLESRISGTVSTIEDNPLLKAVAAAVAEAGPWDASMEQVARRSGLSKSSLYCHFKNKRDMLYQLFMTESLRIIDFAKKGMRLSGVPQEQLYLGIFSIAEYLRSKPDILVTLDWVRNRRLNLHPAGGTEDCAANSAVYTEPPIEFLRLFEELDIGPLQNSGNPFRGVFAGEGEQPVISPWILFLIVKTLTRKDATHKDVAQSGFGEGDVPNSDIRCLYHFITLGIGGFKINEKC